MQQRLDHLEEFGPVSRSEVDLAAKYLHCAVKFYKREADREKVIKDR